MTSDERPAGPGRRGATRAIVGRVSDRHGPDQVVPLRHAESFENFDVRASEEAEEQSSEAFVDRGEKQHHRRHRGVGEPIGHRPRAGRLQPGGRLVGLGVAAQVCVAIGDRKDEHRSAPHAGEHAVPVASDGGHRPEAVPSRPHPAARRSRHPGCSRHSDCDGPGRSFGRQPRWRPRCPRSCAPCGGRGRRLRTPSPVFLFRHSTFTSWTRRSVAMRVFGHPRRCCSPPNSAPCSSSARSSRHHRC